MNAKSEETKGLVPKLRFPEFRGDGGWMKLPLNVLLDSITNGLVLNQNGDHKGYRVTRIETISDGTINLERTGFIECTEDLSNYKLNIGDILFSHINSMAHIGKSAFIDREYDLYHGMNLLRLKPNKKMNDPRFIFLLFGTPYFRSQVRAKANKAVNQASINQTTLGKILTPSPSLVEQQKIADCLGSLDDLIAAHRDKLTALQDHKKGLLQKLFPAEGQTTPELRFSGFEGEWVSKPLKKIASYQNGKAYEKHIVEDGKLIVVNSRFVSTEGQVKKFTNEVFCPAETGDVLMVLSDLPKGRALAKCFFVEKDKTYGVNQRVCRLRPTGIHNKFLYYRLNRHRSLLAFDDGITQTHLSKSDVRDCEMQIPNNPKEQKAIADCLSALDDQISAQTDQIAALQEHKKGLMQQMFPNPELNAT